MFWFVGTDTAQQISAVKLPVSSKILKKSLVTKGLVFNSPSPTLNNLLTYEIYGDQSTNVQNRSSGGVLNNWCNLKQNIAFDIGFGMAFLHNNRKKELSFITIDAVSELPQELPHD